MKGVWDDCYYFVFFPVLTEGIWNGAISVIVYKFVQQERIDEDLSLKKPKVGEIQVFEIDVHIAHHCLNQKFGYA